MFSIASDVLSDTDRELESLRLAAEAGFARVHWCHHWHTDRRYTSAEMAELRGHFAGLGLRAAGVHGSLGVEGTWGDTDEARRRLGVDLVRNRLELAHALETDVVVMHLPRTPPASGVGAPLLRSLEELGPYARALGVRIAIENLERETPVEEVLARADASVFGFCYDSGHGHMMGDGLARLRALLDRTVFLHLHDNDGRGDLHWLPFTGTCDWRGLAGVLGRARAPIPGCIEVSARGREGEVGAFLAEARRAGARLEAMIAAGGRGGP